MTKKCGTCHHACRCREEVFAEVIAALESALETMKENEWYTPLSVIVQAEKAIKKAKGEK